MKHKQIITVTKTELPPLSEYQEFLKKIWAAHWVTNNGQFLLELEKKLRSRMGTDNVIVVLNGTLAMQLPLKSLPNRKGEIITTPFTFQATTNVIAWEGYVPVFADIDPLTWNIDPYDVERKITKDTVAILAVHVYGNACDVNALTRIAKRHNIMLIFDAAHAFDVLYKGKQLVTYGDVSTLSFHATKTFHTIEGGAIVTNSASLLVQYKKLRNFGIESEELVTECGINAKLNEFSAAMGLLNLTYQKKRREQRKRIYVRYMSFLHRIQGITLQKQTVDEPNYTYVPILLPNKTMRDGLYNHMKKHDVLTRKYFYPLTSDAIYIQEDTYISKYKNGTPVARSISDRVLCLPMYASLTLSDVDFICSQLKSFIGSRS